jgi:molybdopterin-guanine dinucleotide biosynthesis protein A
LTAVILAGGEGKRMGVPKAYLTLRGKPILHWIVDRLRPWCDEFIVVIGPNTDRPLSDSQLRKTLPGSAAGIADHLHWPEGVTVIRDEIEGQGPLGGLRTGLARARNPLAFVVSCDAPFVSAPLLNSLLTHAEGADVVVAECEGRPQPLQALYRTDLSRRALERLNRQSRKMMDFLKDASLRVHTVAEAEWISRGVPPFTFMNINTPEDLLQVSSLLDHPTYADLL